VQEGAQPVDGQPRLRQRAGLGRRDPAAVPPRGGGARADPSPFDECHLDVAPAQVVGAAETGYAAPDDDDLHAGTPAVTSTSIRMPGTVKPVTIVVRTGRGAGKYSAQTRFQASKLEASSR
jgi:hypothetical protein